MVWMRIALRASYFCITSSQLMNCLEDSGGVVWPCCVCHGGWALEFQKSISGSRLYLCLPLPFLFSLLLPVLSKGVISNHDTKFQAWYRLLCVWEIFILLWKNNWTNLENMKEFWTEFKSSIERWSSWWNVRLMGQDKAGKVDKQGFWLPLHAASLRLSRGTFPLPFGAHGLTSVLLLQKALKISIRDHSSPRIVSGSGPPPLSLAQ